MKLYIGIVSTAVLFALASVASAELQLASPFSDNAVLQRDKPVAVWGTADVGGTVALEFADQTATTVADTEGRWRAELKPLTASSTPGSLTVRSGTETITLSNIVVGEVWLASGQSNMQFSMKACARSLSEINDAMNDPDRLGIRMLRIGSEAKAEPVDAFDRTQFSWRMDSSEARANQSAVAFFFARRLHQELGVPIGVIETSWGGKPIEGFIPREQFVEHAALKPLLELADANKLEELRKIEGGVFIRNSAGHPGRIFNARVAPVAPYSVRGAIWYQGESNAGIDEDPRGYRHKMRALIDGWRDAFEQPEMPFYFVQLPAFRDEMRAWSRLREEQRLSLAIPRTGMAVTIDLRSNDIHPPNKIDVAERLARWPLFDVYGQSRQIQSGPLFRSAEFNDGLVRVRFDFVGDGLMVAWKEGLQSAIETPDAELQQFEVCGADGVWHAAAAKIDGIEVVVTCGEVAQPVSVRYAIGGAPANANLYNQAGLPASPFSSNLDAVPWQNVPKSSNSKSR